MYRRFDDSSYAMMAMTARGAEAMGEVHLPRSISSTVGHIKLLKQQDSSEAPSTQAGLKWARKQIQVCNGGPFPPTLAAPAGCL